MTKKLLPLLLFVILISCKKEKDEPVIPTDGLVAYFSFDNTYEDESNNSNTCIPSGTYFSSNRFGNPNSSISFDGYNDFMKISHSPSLDFDAYTDSYTINIWVKSNNPTSGSSEYGRIFTKWNEYKTTNYPFSIVQNQSVCLGATFDGDVINKSSVSYGNIWDGSWHMITFRVNQDSDLVSAYIDGNLVDEVSNNVTESAKNNLDIIIGYCWPNEVYYKGQMDDIRIYNRALSNSEIKSLYDL